MWKVCTVGVSEAAATRVDNCVSQKRTSRVTKKIHWIIKSRYGRFPLSLSLWVYYHSRISPWKVLRVGVSEEAAMVGALSLLSIVGICVLDFGANSIWRWPDRLY